MKNYILIFSMATMLFACSKKNDVKPVTPLTATDANLSGKWAATADSTYNTQNGITNVLAQSFTNGLYYQFNVNGTGVIGSNASSPENFTYTISNGVIQLTIKPADGGSVDPLNYSILAITDNKMIISYVSGNSRSDIAFTK